jgi:hypothetical protein
MPEAPARRPRSHSADAVAVAAAPRAFPAHRVLATPSTPACRGESAAAAPRSARLARNSIRTGRRPCSRPRLILKLLSPSTSRPGSLRGFRHTPTSRHGDPPCARAMPWSVRAGARHGGDPGQRRLGGRGGGLCAPRGGGPSLDGSEDGGYCDCHPGQTGFRQSSGPTTVTPSAGQKLPNQPLQRK